MGKWYDIFKADALATGLTPLKADAIAGSSVFLKVAIMPAMLVVVFILIYLFRKRQRAEVQEAQLSIKIN